MTPQQIEDKAREYAIPHKDMTVQYGDAFKLSYNSFIAGYNLRNDEVQELKEVIKELTSGMAVKFQEKDAETETLKEVLRWCKSYFGDHDKTPHEHHLFSLIENS